MSGKVSFSSFNRENCCQLCQVVCSDAMELLYHNKYSVEHTARTRYIEGIYDKISNIVKVNVINYRGALPYVLTDFKNPIDFFINVTNISQGKIEIDGVVKLNKAINELDINFINSFPIELNPGRRACLRVSGKFKNSYEFGFEFLVVYREAGKKQQEVLLHNVHIIITSEYSFLSENKNNTKFQNGKRVIAPQTIVKAGSLTTTDFMQEYIRLDQYIMPPWFKYANKNRYKQESEFRIMAEELGVPIEINEKDYCDILHVLLYIEESYLMQENSVDISELENIAEGLYKLNINGSGLKNVLVGQPIYLFAGQNSEVKFEAIVTEKTTNDIKLLINRRFEEMHSTTVEFHTEVKLQRRCLRVEHQAIDLVKNCNVEKYFFPQGDITIIPNTKEIEFYHKNLNHEQKVAVENILNERNVPYLLFGPPGTGKTTTLVEAVLQVFKLKNFSKILICTPSNASANEIAGRLQKISFLKKDDMFRLYGASYVYDGRYDFRGMSNINQDHEFQVPDFFDIMDKRIITTTLTTASRIYNCSLLKFKFDYVFIDESGYATETQTLIPISAFLAKMSQIGKISGQVILAGDPKQLGPVIKSNFAIYCGLGQSLLERLMKTCDIYKIGNEQCVTKLIRNYRSHPEILKIPNRLFYDNELISEVNEVNNRFGTWRHLGKSNFPLIFHNIDGDERRAGDSASFYNIQEIEVVMNYLIDLLFVNQIPIKQEDIGIISPYAKQVEKLTEACQLKHWEEILIGSVEQLQGKEKDVIIISTVRSRNNKVFKNRYQLPDLGFVTHPQRFNVAVTRARSLLIVIGNQEYLEMDANWRELIKHCGENDSIKGNKLLIPTVVDENSNVI